MADTINKYAKKRLRDLDEEANPQSKKLREYLEEEEKMDEAEKRRRKIARENRARIARGEKPLPVK